MSRLKPLGYGLWRKQDGFFSITGWCRDPAHADLRTIPDEINALRKPYSIPDDVKLVRMYENGSHDGFVNPRSWEIVECPSV